jgi:hypothetical protein
MEYPSEVQKRIDILNSYIINPNLSSANIFHLYPKELAYPDGFYDSRFFTLVCFNTLTNEKRIIENRDGLDFYSDLVIDLYMIRIYVDGSTMVRFGSLQKFDIFQSVIIGNAN